MSVCALAADVGFLLGCAAAVSASDVLFLLRLGLDLGFFFLWTALCTTFESNAIQDYRIDIVASTSHIIYH